MRSADALVAEERRQQLGGRRRVSDSDADLDGTVAWSSLLAEATERLTGIGFESAAIDARRIAEEAAGV